MRTPKHDQIDDYGYPIWDDNSFPLAYLITFRTFGTWLHGDERTSVKRDGWNRYGHPRYKANKSLQAWMREEMSHGAVVLNDAMRRVVDEAIRQLCERRGYSLLALNVRTNHAHAVISATMKPERIVDAMKAASTKALRDGALVLYDAKVWSRGRSRRYLWKPAHVAAAVEYTLHGQGDFVMPD